MSAGKQKSPHFSRDSARVDKIYDECALIESHSLVIVKKYYDADLAKYLRMNDYLIIKAHGTVDETSKMIFTHKQYSQARCQNASFYKLLDLLILTLFSYFQIFLLLP